MYSIYDFKVLKQSFTATSSFFEQAVALEILEWLPEHGSSWTKGFASIQTLTLYWAVLSGVEATVVTSNEKVHKRYKCNDMHFTVQVGK